MNDTISTTEALEIMDRLASRTHKYTDVELVYEELEKIRDYILSGAKEKNGGV